MFSKKKSSGSPALPIPGLEGGGVLNGLFVAGPGFPAVAVRVTGTLRRLEIRDDDNLLIAAWGWLDIVPIRQPRPPDMTGLCVADKRFPSQQLVITDPTPLPDSAQEEPSYFVEPPKKRKKRALRKLGSDPVPAPPVPSSSLDSGASLRADPDARPVVSPIMRSARRRKTRLSGSMKAFLTCLVVVLLGAAAIAPLVLNPKRIEGLAVLVSAGTEESWGTALLIQLDRRGVRECRAPLGRQTLDKLIARLDPGTAPWPMDVAVVDSPAPQALTLPGGRIVVTDGMIKALRTPDELAAVIAAAMARSLQRSEVTNALRAYGVRALAPLLFGRFDSPPLRLDTVLSNSARADRKLTETDALTITLLQDARLRPRSLGLLLQNVQSNPTTFGGAGEGLLAPYALSQPVTTARLRRVNQAERGGDIALNAGEWEAVRSICR